MKPITNGSPALPKPENVPVEKPRLLDADGNPIYWLDAEDLRRAQEGDNAVTSTANSARPLTSRTTSILLCLRAGYLKHEVVKSALKGGFSVHDVQSGDDIMSIPAYAVLVDIGLFRSDELARLYESYSRSSADDAALVFVGKLTDPPSLRRSYHGVETIIVPRTSEGGDKFEWAEYLRSLRDAV